MKKTFDELHAEMRQRFPLKSIWTWKGYRLTVIGYRVRQNEIVIRWENSQLLRQFGYASARRSWKKVS